MAAEEVKFIFSMDDLFSKQAKQAQANVSILENGLTALAGVAAGAFSIGAVVSFGKSVVDAYGRMEMFKTSLTTMLQGNKDEANALNEQLINIAKTTPFELTEIQDATRQLIAYGSEAGNIKDELNTLGNVAAGIGAPIKDIAYLYGTIRTQGRAMTVDINQFANRGIPIWRELEKITGKNGLALRKFVEEGKVGFGQIQQVMANLTKEGGQFYNLMENQSKTVTGQISNLADAWEQLKVSIGESQTGIIKSTLNWSTRLVNDITEVIQSGNRLENAFAKGGGRQYSFMEKRGYFGFGSQKSRDEFDNFSEMRDSWHNRVQKVSGNEAELHKLYQSSANAILSLIERKGEKGLSATEWNRSFAVLKDVQSEIKGSLDLMKSEQKAKANTPKTETAKEAAKVRTPHYTQIHININEMIHEYNVKTETSNQVPSITKDHVLKAMVSAVEDAQIVAGR